MIRKDREVVEHDSMVKILERCHVLHIAFNGTEFPYIVPVSFGICNSESGLSIYFHCAKNGMKIDRLNNDPDICFESDIFYKTEEMPYGITARYESVIGFGKIEAVSDNEKLKGLRAICEHYGYGSYDVLNCKSFQATSVYKIKVESITGKSNIPTN